MRTARTLALALVVATVPGCSLLFAPSTFSSGGGDAGRSSDGGTDAPSPSDSAVDAPVADTGLDGGSDSGADGGSDAGADAGPMRGDYWAACLGIEARSLHDANVDLVTLDPSLMTALGVGSSFAIASDRPLPTTGATLGRVVMGVNGANELYVAVAPGAGGPPLVMRIDRTTLTATMVTVTGYSGTLPIIDLAMTRVGSNLALGVLEDGGFGYDVCTLSGTTCPLVGGNPSRSISDPIALALASDGTSPTVVLLHRNRTDGMACMSRGTATATCLAEPPATAPYVSQSSGGALVTFEASTTLWGGLPTRTSIGLDGTRMTGLVTRSGQFGLVQVASVTGGFDLRTTAVNCAGGGGCLTTPSATAAFTAQVGTPIAIASTAIDTTRAATALAISYPDGLGTDVRLYATDGAAAFPITTGRGFVTLGSGRTASVTGTASSVATAVVSDGTSVDFFAVAVASVSGSQRAYLSALRLCRL